jgi:hypothetical protein
MTIWPAATFDWPKALETIASDAADTAAKMLTRLLNARLEFMILSL